MKVSRLISILAILLRQGTAAAPELAKRLEVSSRTIRRDIDDLCLAGIPLLTRQGAGGGIFISEGYRLDGRLFSSGELRSVLAGIQGLDSVNAAGDAKALIGKLSGGEDFPTGDILIDLASYYRDSLSVKIDLLQKAVANRKLVAFDYWYEKGRQRRRVEPYCLLYKWTSWYLFAYCLKRSDFRTFKLNRLWDLRVEETFYAPRAVPAERLNCDEFPRGTKTTVVLFDASVEYLLIESYGPESYSRLPDGRLRFEWEYADAGHIMRWILSFGRLAEVVFPGEIRQAVAEEVRKMSLRYREPDTQLSALSLYDESVIPKRPECAAGTSIPGGGISIMSMSDNTNDSKATNPKTGGPKGNDLKRRAEKLLDPAGAVFLATNGKDGIPDVRAMSPVRSEGLGTVWMITGDCSDKCRELEKDPRCALYAFENAVANEECAFLELRLQGTVEILNDPESRALTWKDEYFHYFPAGKDDPNLRVLKFTAKSGTLQSMDEEKTPLDL